jgi:hypothetical protein
MKVTTGCGDENADQPAGKHPSQVSGDAGREHLCGKRDFVKSRMSRPLLVKSKQIGYIRCSLQINV